jgi:hypothetical protein
MDLAERVPDRFRAMILVGHLRDPPPRRGLWTTTCWPRSRSWNGVCAAQPDRGSRNWSRPRSAEVSCGSADGLPPGVCCRRIEAASALVCGPRPFRVRFYRAYGEADSARNFNPLVGWAKHVESMGKVGLHFHDLRHPGNTLAAQSGASTRDLMARMGHDSMNAAIIYQHATRRAARAIADALDDQLRAGSHGGDPDQGRVDGVVPA